MPWWYSVGEINLAPQCMWASVRFEWLIPSSLYFCDNSTFYAKNIFFDRSFWFLAQLVYSRWAVIYGAVASFFTFIFILWLSFFAHSFIICLLTQHSSLFTPFATLITICSSRTKWAQGMQLSGKHE